MHILLVADPPRGWGGMSDGTPGFAPATSLIHAYAKPLKRRPTQMPYIVNALFTIAIILMTFSAILWLDDFLIRFDIFINYEAFFNLGIWVGLIAMTIFFIDRVIL